MNHGICEELRESHGEDCVSEFREVDRVGVKQTLVGPDKSLDFILGAKNQ